jgi:hypothetical protein
VLSRQIKEPDGSIPPYLALSEMTRRKKLREEAGASPQPQTTIAEEVVASVPQMQMPMGGGIGSFSSGQNVQPQAFAGGGYVDNPTYSGIGGLADYHAKRAADYTRIVKDLEARGERVPPEYYRMIAASQQELPSVPPAPPMPLPDPEMDPNPRFGGRDTPPSAPPLPGMDPGFPLRMETRRAGNRMEDVQENYVPLAPPLPAADPGWPVRMDMGRDLRKMDDAIDSYGRNVSLDAGIGAYGGATADPRTPNSEVGGHRRCRGLARGQTTTSPAQSASCRYCWDCLNSAVRWRSVAPRPWPDGQERIGRRSGRRR